MDSLTRIGVEFNTVAWHVLSWPFRHFLLVSRSTAGESAEQLSYSLAARRAAETLTLRFINGVDIYRLLTGKARLDLVFQLGTWMRWLHLFRRPVLPNTLLLFTSNYVVVIEKKLGVKQG